MSEHKSGCSKVNLNLKQALGLDKFYDSFSNPTDPSNLSQSVSDGLAPFRLLKLADK